MAKWIEVGGTAETGVATMREVVADGLEILLVRVGDSYFATANRCPHMGGRLSDGTLEGTVVTCPLHGSQFDVRDGSVVRWLKTPRLISAMSKVVKPSKPVDTYRVKVEGERILVEV